MSDKLNLIALNALCYADSSISFIRETLEFYDDPELVEKGAELSDAIRRSAVLLSHWEVAEMSPEQFTLSVEKMHAGTWGGAPT